MTIELNEQEFEEVLTALHCIAIEAETKYIIERTRYFNLRKANKYIKGKRGSVRLVELVSLRKRSRADMKFYLKMYQKQLEAKTKELWK